jgi:fluoroacetyl-CoA thioesterase
MRKSRTAEASLRMIPPVSAEAERLSPEDSFPAVTETSRLIDLMELAAARALNPELRNGEASVALRTDLRFVSESRSVPWMRAVATRTGTRGRVHHFTVNVFGESGLIASAAHTRAVVVVHRLEGLARRRAGRPSLQLNV